MLRATVQENAKTRAEILQKYRNSLEESGETTMDAQKDLAKKKKPLNLSTTAKTHTIRRNKDRMNKKHSSFHTYKCQQY